MVYVYVEATSPHYLNSFFFIYIYIFFSIAEFLVNNYITHESTSRESESTNQRIATSPLPKITVNDAVSFLHHF